MIILVSLVASVIPTCPPQLPTNSPLVPPDESSWDIQLITKDTAALTSLQTELSSPVTSSSTSQLFLMLSIPLHHPQLPSIFWTSLTMCRLPSDQHLSFLPQVLPLRRLHSHVRLQLMMMTSWLVQQRLTRSQPVPPSRLHSHVRPLHRFRPHSHMRPCLLRLHRPHRHVRPRPLRLRRPHGHVRLRLPRLRRPRQRWFSLAVLRPAFHRC
jgi:hypothetical protein